MDISFIRRFMLIFGPLSSLFDYATFAVLLWLMKADQQSFQTGWFIESILSAGVVVFSGAHAPAVHPQSPQPRRAGCDRGGHSDYVVVSSFTTGWSAGLCAAVNPVSAAHFWDRGTVL